MAADYTRLVPPGGTGQITLKLSTHGKAGDTIRHKATLYTNDPENAALELTMTGDVIPPADIQPQSARLIGPAGAAVSTRITITPPAANLFHITGAQAADGKNITFSIKKPPDEKAHGFILEVTNTRKTPGRYSDQITLSTTSPISPELTVRIYGIMREN